MPPPKIPFYSTEEIGRLLAAARRVAGLDQNEVARAIGASGTTISNYETAVTARLDYPLRLLALLAKANRGSRGIVLQLIGLTEGDLTEAREEDDELTALFRDLRAAKESDPDWGDTVRLIRRLVPPRKPPRRESRAART